MSELLPCPFCGGKAVDDTHSKRTGCPRCGIWVHRTTLTHEGGISRSVEREATAWNTRADHVDDLLKAEREKALLEAAEVCERIRTQKINGPMPERACFDYEQSIHALISEEKADG